MVCEDFVQLTARCDIGPVEYRLTQGARVLDVDVDLAPHQGFVTDHGSAQSEAPLDFIARVLEHLGQHLGEQIGFVAVLAADADRFARLGDSVCNQKQDENDALH